MQVAVLPASSLTSHSTVVTPDEKAEPDGGSHSTIGFSSTLSDLVTTHVVVDDEITISAGHVTMGATWSEKVDNTMYCLSVLAQYYEI